MMTLCYIHVPGDQAHNAMEERFVQSYLDFPPGVEHQTLIISQGGIPSKESMEMLGRLPNVRYLHRESSGLDIGGYIDASPLVETKFMLCMGGSSTVRKSGWMARMIEAAKQHGDGFYGGLSSYQIRPHLNTTGFWCPPLLLATYPTRVVTKGDRYEFEHGRGSLWWRLNQSGFPTLMVTWDGEYEWMDWRKPHNISCRGDQSNCLTYFRINYDYEHHLQHDPGALNNLMYLTDAHILDDDFKVALKYLTDPQTK